MNEAKKTLTMEFVESIMDENYTLVWVDYRESLNENRDLLQQCLEKQGCEDLWSKVEDWYEDAEEQATLEIIKGLKSHCIDFYDFEEEEVEAFFEEHEDEIRDEIRERDDSTTVNDLIKNTRDIPVRVEMLSNYDCINSCWLESHGGFRYNESYFGDMIDTLRLNPAKVKKALMEKGYTVYGRFPNRKYRDGKEQVSYEDFCQELENSCCGANLLTYIGLVNLRDLYDADFKIKEVIIPKGNTCGLFSSMYGGGSLIEMELKSDVRIRLDKARKDGYGFRLRLDNERSEYDCSIKHVYGVCDSFFGKQVGSTAGVLQLLAEILVGYLLLTVTILSVRESSIYRISLIGQCLLHLCRVEAKGIYHISEVTILVSEAAL